MTRLLFNLDIRALIMASRTNLESGPQFPKVWKACLSSLLNISSYIWHKQDHTKYRRNLNTRLFQYPVTEIRPVFESWKIKRVWHIGDLKSDNLKSGNIQNPDFLKMSEAWWNIGMSSTLRDEGPRLYKCATRKNACLPNWCDFLDAIMSKMSSQQ